MTSTMNSQDLDGEELARKRSEARDHLRQLGMRIANPKNPGPPPWCWVNLGATESALLDQALDEFVGHYNRIHAGVLEEVIPRCWRKHPALAQELPVQFWAWWASHIDVRATVPVAVEYYSRGLPGFQTRLPKLIGKGATNCRQGNHVAPSDPELIDATSFAVVGKSEDTGRSPETRRALHQDDFGAMEGLA
jgi:hypothetical protein